MTARAAAAAGIRSMRLTLLSRAAQAAPMTGWPGHGAPAATRAAIVASGRHPVIDHRRHRCDGNDGKRSPPDASQASHVARAGGTWT